MLFSSFFLKKKLESQYQLGPVWSEENERKEEKGKKGNCFLLIGLRKNSNEMKVEEN